MGQTGYFTPTAVKPLGERPNPHGGTLATFACDFKDAAENLRTNVYWARKAGNDPQVGSAYYGELTDGEKGPRFFTRTPPPDGSAPLPSVSQAPSQPSGDSGGFTPQNNNSPRDNAIQRQHSQEMALRLIDATGDARDLDLTDEILTREYLKVVRKLTDYFQRDIDHDPGAVKEQS